MFSVYHYIKRVMPISVLLNELYATPKTPGRSAGDYPP